MAPKKPRTRRPDQLPPGRHGLTAADVAASQRQRLVAAVIEAVAARGYERTRVADILARAGVSRRTYYEHFDDLDDCFLIAYDREIGLLSAAVSEAFESSADGNWADQVHSGLRGLLRHLAARPAAARVIAIEILGAGHTGVARRDAAMRSFTYFVDAGRGDSTTEVPGRTALALIGAINELVASEIIKGSTNRLEGLTADLVYIVCVPFLGRDRALEERARAAAEGGAPPV